MSPTNHQANQPLASSEWSKTERVNMILAELFYAFISEGEKLAKRLNFILSVVRLYVDARKLPWGSAH